MATTAGNYSVKVSDQNTCTATDQIQLTSKGKPTVEVPTLLKICDPDTIITVSGTFNSLIWSDGSTDPSIRINDYGVYSVSVSDSFCSSTVSLEVQNTCPPIIYVPNAFTPESSEGLNDVFLPVIRNVKEIDLQIYNRWGELLFETTQLQQGWDGNYQNQTAAADVYVYTIRYTGVNNTKGTLSGNVTLLK